jgi:uncharacterized membrane protein
MELLKHAAGWEQTARWLHILSGICWIGLLYFFNFVQVPAYAGMDATARNHALHNVTRRGLWWFRWAAVATFLTGLLIISFDTEYHHSEFWKTRGGLGIETGMLIAIIMLLNVWGVIWRNNKVVLANAQGVLEGKPADPNAAVAGRKAAMASRQNANFSIVMVFLMIFPSHIAPLLDQASTSNGLVKVLTGSQKGIYWAITLVLIGGLELNALGFMPWKAEPKKGLNVIYDSVRNVLIAGFVLWAV